MARYGERDCDCSRGVVGRIVRVVGTMFPEGVPHMMLDRNINNTNTGQLWGMRCHEPTRLFADGWFSHASMGLSYCLGSGRDAGFSSNIPDCESIDFDWVDKRPNADPPDGDGRELAQ